MSLGSSTKVRVAIIAVLSLLGACRGGLHTEAGNAFPCDYTRGPGARDKMCPSAANGPGDYVCGVDDRCHPFVRDELLSVEAEIDKGALPKFDQSRAAVLYPTLPVSRVTTFVPEFRPLQPLRRLGVVSEGDRSERMIDLGCFGVSEAGTVPEGVVEAGAAYSIVQPNGDRLQLWLDGKNGTVTVRDETSDGVTEATAHSGLQTFDQILELRAMQPLPVSGIGMAMDQLALVVARVEGADPKVTSPDPAVGWVPELRVAGELGHRPALPNPIQFEPFDLPSLPDGSRPTVRDASTVFYRGIRRPVVLADDGFYVRCSSRVLPSGPKDGACVSGPKGEETWLRIPQSLPGRPRSLSSNPDGSLWTVISDQRVAANVVTQLATFAVTDSADGGLSLEALWLPCVPCRHARATIATPSLRKGAHVDVLCDSNADGERSRSLVRVNESTNGLCETEAFTPLIDTNELAIVQDTLPGVLLAGGRHGQVWMGETLGDAVPRFLDRAPNAVTVQNGKLLAITDAYLAVEVPGYGMLPIASAQGDQPSAVIENLPGGFILPSADVVEVASAPEPPPGCDQTTPEPDGGFEPTELELNFGPRLAGPQGGAAQGPFLAEAVPWKSGKVQLVASASDSLYFTDELKTEATAPDPANALIASITPEPNFPIRSLTVDQSLANKDQSPLVTHGYLVTSRNLFEFSYRRNPRVWELATLPQLGGEPVEVAMQLPGSIYGRVFYRDGSVYTLPSGLMLTSRLEQNGEALRVRDFLQLRGRPFAVTDQGVFVAEPPDHGPDPSKGERYSVWEWSPLPVPSPTPMAESFTPGLLTMVPETLAGGDKRETVYLFDAHGAVVRVGDNDVQE